MPAARSTRSTTLRNARASSPSTGTKKPPTKRTRSSKTPGDQSIPVLPPSPTSPLTPIPLKRTPKVLSISKGVSESHRDAPVQPSSPLPTPPRTPFDAGFDLAAPAFAPHSSFNESLVRFWCDLDRLTCSTLIDLILALTGETGVLPSPSLPASIFMPPLYDIINSLDECIATYHPPGAEAKQDFPVLEAKAIPRGFSPPPPPAPPSTPTFELGFSADGRADLRLVVPQPAVACA